MKYPVNKGRRRGTSGKGLNTAIGRFLAGTPVKHVKGTPENKKITLSAIYAGPSIEGKRVKLIEVASGKVKHKNIIGLRSTPAGNAGTVGPTIEGKRLEFIEVASGKVERKKPTFA